MDGDDDNGTTTMMIAPAETRPDLDRPGRTGRPASPYCHNIIIVIIVIIIVIIVPANPLQHTCTHNA